MAICGSCNGTGKVTCFGCGGRGYKTRMTLGGEMETNACLVCGGSRKIKCSFCGGRGKVGSERAEVVPHPGKRNTDEDILEGTWNAQGGRYVFVKAGDHYEVTEYGVIGRTGNGTAKVFGNTVTMEITNILTGRMVVTFQLQADVLRGSTVVFGIKLPFILNRG